MLDVLIQYLIYIINFQFSDNAIFNFRAMQFSDSYNALDLRDFQYSRNYIMMLYYIKLQNYNIKLNIVLKHLTCFY
jgi:hypothetical protein